MFLVIPQGINTTHPIPCCLSKKSWHDSIFIGSARRSMLKENIVVRADSRFAPSQWETALLCNNVSHWLGASLESALEVVVWFWVSLILFLPSKAMQHRKCWWQKGESCPGGRYWNYYPGALSLTHWPLVNLDAILKNQFSILFLCWGSAELLMLIPSGECHGTLPMSILVQVMAWCRQATSHYLSQCWPRSMPPNGVLRVNELRQITTTGADIVQMFFNCK